MGKNRGGKKIESWLSVVFFSSFSNCVFTSFLSQVCLNSTRDCEVKGLELEWLCPIRGRAGRSVINHFPNKPWFLRFCSTSLLKTLWEKEKLLVTSNFSFSHSVFYLFGEFSAVFVKIEIVVCIPIDFGRV